MRWGTPKAAIFRSHSNPAPSTVSAFCLAVTQMIKKVHSRRLFLKTALAQAGVMATSTFHISAYGYRARPMRPLALAGFNERRDDPAGWERHQEIADERNKFCREKAELIRRMDACRRDCKGAPAIKHFSDMIDYIRGVPDKRMQALLVNAWVNLAVCYDPPTRPYRSLIGALTDAKGGCYEIAELKLAALEILSFPADDVRLVAELSTTNGKRDEDGHAVVEVRIDGRNWIMNASTYACGIHRHAQRLLPCQLSFGYGTGLCARKLQQQQLMDSKRKILSVGLV